MAHFVLIHGAWHAGSCFRKLADELEAAGHRAYSPDLPGHGDDPTPHDRVDLEAYVDRVCEVVDSIDGAVTLLGHSLGGLTISQVAEHRADRIASLVYLAAFIPEPSGTIAEMTALASDRLHQSIQPSADGHSSLFDPERAEEVFYGDCSPEDVSSAIAGLCPQPLRVFHSEVRLSSDGFGSVPRDYVLCLQDEAVPATSQQTMIDRHPCRCVHRLDRSHSPFLSAPGELAKILGDLSAV